MIKHPWAAMRLVDMPADLQAAIHNTSAALRRSCSALVAWETALKDLQLREYGAWKECRQTYRERQVASLQMARANKAQSAVMAAYGIGDFWTVLEAPAQELAA